MFHASLRAAFAELSALYTRVDEEDAGRWLALPRSGREPVTLRMTEKWLCMSMPLQDDVNHAIPSSWAVGRCSKVAQHKDGWRLACEVPRAREGKAVSLLLQSALRSFAAVAGVADALAIPVGRPALSISALAALVVDAGWQAVSRDEGVGVPLRIPGKYIAARVTDQRDGWLLAQVAVASLADAPEECLLAAEHCAWQANGFLRFARLCRQEGHLLFEVAVPHDAEMLHFALSSLHAGVTILGEEMETLCKYAAVAQAYCVVNSLALISGQV